MPANRKQHGKDTAVQGTNDSSVVSKVSAAAQDYFQDIYLQHFVCKVARRAPLINRGYYVRWRAVDHCIRRFLETTKDCPKRQILSLGAGFDSLYFRLQSDGALSRVVVFEVDFPDVTQRKAALINSNDILRKLLGFDSYSATGFVYLYCPQYRLLGVDVRETSQMEKALVSAGLEWAAPTLILSEVVLTYMENKWSDYVICWAAEQLPQSLFLIYEQIHPSDPFGQIMQEHFRKLNSTLYAVQQYPDIESQRRRFLDKGWEQCVCLDMNCFYLGLVPETERLKIEDLEPFDEYEEWHQKCSHYFILTASRGALTAEALLHSVSPLTTRSPYFGPISLNVRTIPVTTEGIGMASFSLSPNVVLLTGGSGKGGREAQIGMLLRNNEHWKYIRVETSTDFGVCMYHTASALSERAGVVLGGRTSPLNPVKSISKLTLGPCILGGQDSVKLCVEHVVCGGNSPAPRWRHTTTVVTYKGKDQLFVFGGKNGSQIYGDGNFLDLDHNLWTEVTVEGAAPEARFSHSACTYEGGIVIFGGMGRRGVPLGDATLLRQTESGFCWERIDITPPPIPRYSHSAHMIGARLIVAGGVWLHSHVPGVAVIDLGARSSIEFRLDTTTVPWPLMLHSFCSELICSNKELLLIGGGGNCFSFGTHFNPQPVAVDLRPVLAIDNRTED